MTNKLNMNYYMAMPSNIYYWWNFGSLLGMCMMIQILSGLMLSMFYENNLFSTFDSINQIMRNINNGWIIRIIHANGASLFFILMYLHMGRSLFFKSFSNLPKVWMSGFMLMLLLFMTAFMGYVLPWGQMSYWGATVITNLLTSIPYIGNMITLWLWGSFSVSKSTLMRFFTFHFLMPMIMTMMMIIHIIFLHEKGSNNPLGLSSLTDKIPFYPYFIWKDIMGILICLFMFMLLLINFPFLLSDPDNFIAANPMITPPHIQPEWYFLFAYAILRTIPNKLGGVIALFSAILIFLVLPFVKKAKYSIMKNKMMSKMLIYFWLNNFIYLTLMGMMPIEMPFIFFSKISSIIYFLMILFI